MDTYVAGGGLSRFGKRSESMQQLMAEAAEVAFAEARAHGVTRESVEAVVVGILNPAEFLDEGNSASLITDSLGLAGAAAWRVETASSTGAAALHSACHAVAAGRFRTVLVLGGEKKSHQDTAQVTARLARMIDRSERRMGATMTSLAALIAEYYRRAHRIGPEAFEVMRGRVAVKNRRNGCANPKAHFRRELTLEQFSASRHVSTPLRLFDCGPISDGAAALIVTSRRTPLRVSGLGHATDTQALSRRSHLAFFASTRRAAAQAYRMAGIGPSDIELAEVHDAFTAIEIMSAEDLGLFPPGAYGAALQAGRVDPGGDLPVNASGGLLARGHPIGASGLAQVIELSRRLGREGVRRGGPPRRGVALSMGGLATNNLVTVLELEGASPPDDGAPLPAVPEAPQAPLDAPDPEGGVVRASTTLFSPPAGFEGPLHFALVEGRAEGLSRTVLARAPRPVEAEERVRLARTERGLFIL
ncbi:MAG: thiolase family protein [Candidatus Tectomicrobia bacterium]|uniref:propanoyl-CoA C-acyltransferase n=1 Tax=Tectimicrobiota bacterium TaxID=2528274 RepID=A0A932MQ92_UNCTE|nr:thiolase family protein [Candidatus Tectomicrobia bacterium]